ncbi:MAG: beta-ketoacyl-[acyl-carrier-protein] synthase family protein [Alistipes sp.]|jgi:3-oxoacyl-[acyl-carrier-protein] synthase-1|nr:beta-ketoacyl-[acyl-carrier-protein] synthase family protein [Alistipes sp.]
MKIAVSGLGVISAIGRAVREADGILNPLRRERGELGPLTLFDTPYAGPVGQVRLDNRELKAMLGLDPGAAISRTAMLGMVAAGDALADAGDGAGLRTGLVSATSTGGMDLTEQFFTEFVRDDSQGRLRNVAGHECADSTRRIAAHCGITGFTTTVSTACSSAANAIIFGAGLIRRGLVDRVVAGGTDALCRFTLGGFRSLGILDSEPCRPFDRTRAGLNLGEGAGYIVLQRDDTLTREPWGYLTGWANAGDTFHQTASSATGEGAFRAMAGAIRMAGVQPSDIGYINAHGTATQNNDATEAAAIERLFGGRPGGPGGPGTVPPFSSTKPFTGHTLAAAGGIEAAIALLAMRHGFIPPNLNFATPMDETPLVPQTSPRENVEIHHLLSNSFGFGGNNTSLVFSAR